MGVDLVDHNVMLTKIIPSQPIFRVRVNETLHARGKPQKWLSRFKEGVGKYACKRHMQKHAPGKWSSWIEYSFTDQNTAFFFALHFGGVGHG